MTTTSIKRDAPPTYRENGTHLLAVGQDVRLKGGYGQPVLFPGVFRIIGLLPATEGQPQYRIRNNDERHERVATQANLEPVRKTAMHGGGQVAEQTFDNSRGEAILARGRRRSTLKPA
jgi:hypothetical protein